MKEIKKGYYLKDVATGWCVKITNDGSKDGFVRGSGYKGNREVIIKALEAGTYEIIPTLATNGKIAKLVTVTLKTRVVVPVDATEDEILEYAKPNFVMKVKLELNENLDSIEDDLAVPYGSGYQE